MKSNSLSILSLKKCKFELFLDFFMIDGIITEGVPILTREELAEGKYLLRKLEIQQLLMKKLVDYGMVDHTKEKINHSEDGQDRNISKDSTLTSTPEEDIRALDGWIGLGLAEEFYEIWQNDRELHLLLLTNEPDDQLMELLSNKLIARMSSVEIRKFQLEFWSEVEIKLCEKFHIQFDDYMVFPHAQSRWIKLFKKYLESSLGDKASTGSDVDSKKIINSFVDSVNE